MSVSYFFRGNLPPVANTPTASPTSQTVGSPVTLSATGSDPDGVVVSMEFFVDAVSKGVATNGPAFSVTFTTATVGARQVTAQATDAFGAKSPLSAVAALTVTGANTAPGAPTAATATAGNNAATVTATAPAANGGSAITGYTIFRNGSATALATNVALPYTDATALNGTAYYYAVAAVNAVGTSVPSAVSNTVTPQPTLTATSATPS